MISQKQQSHSKGQLEVFPPFPILSSSSVNSLSPSSVKRNGLSSLGLDARIFFFFFSTYFLATSLDGSSFFGFSIALFFFLLKSSCISFFAYAFLSMLLMLFIK